MICTFGDFSNVHQTCKGVCTFMDGALGENPSCMGRTNGFFPMGRQTRKRAKRSPFSRGASL